MMAGLNSPYKCKSYPWVIFPCSCVGMLEAAKATDALDCMPLIDKVATPFDQQGAVRT